MKLKLLAYNTTNFKKQYGLFLYQILFIKIDDQLVVNFL